MAEASGPLRIDVFSIFPDQLEAYWHTSVLGRGLDRGHLDLRAHDLRAATTDRHRTVDDAPFGGGAGMVLMPDPVFRAVEHVDPPRPLLLMSPAGPTFDQDMARRLADEPDGFSLLCGRYEGIDERITRHLVDAELSIGDFVLAGGELAALVVIEAVARLVPGVLGNMASPVDESFSEGLLEYPHYTRPADFRGWKVPEVLRSGDHALVDRWRRAQSLRRTLDRRPDLLAVRGGLEAEDEALLAEFTPAVDDRPSSGT
jgi:tRNA (guanine37-N1)-methyltransferase